MTKEHILAEIRRVAAANGGVPPGRRTFANETGVRDGDWFGVFWARWGDALAEAGLSPNPIQPRIPDDVLLGKYAELARALGHLPAKGELRLARRRDSNLPSENTFAKFGRKRDLVEQLLLFCKRTAGFDDVERMCSAAAKAEPDAESDKDRSDPVQGYVYLVKSGRHYKIDKSNAVGRRERELAIQLPERVKTVHVIKTDDPSGIEIYWHNRFSAKRGNGEWFELEPGDVQAFKRRRYQ